MRRRAQLGIAIAIAALAVGAVAWHLVDGAHYRLYTSIAAGECWRALELSTLSSSTLELVHAHTPQRGPRGQLVARIDYRMDRVLGGGTLEVRCTFEPESLALTAMEFDGVALDENALIDVQSGLGR